MSYLGKPAKITQGEQLIMALLDKWQIKYHFLLCVP